MDRSTVIYLLSETQTKNEYGVWEKTTERRKVYAEVTSVSQSEWFEGGRAGLNPDLRFRVFRYDYNGEKMVVYNNKTYAIYRTYVDRKEIIELYTEEKKGAEENNADGSSDIVGTGKADQMKLKH